MRLEGLTELGCQDWSLRFPPKGRGAQGRLESEPPARMPPTAGREAGAQEEAGAELAQGLGPK